MEIEILYYVALIGIAISILWLIVFYVYCWFNSIKVKTVFYKGYDLRPRVFLYLRDKWFSCSEGYKICTDCPHFEDCVMRAIEEVKNEIDKKVENDD